MERDAVDAQDLGGAALVSVALVKSAQDVGALDIVQRTCRWSEEPAP